MPDNKKKTAMQELVNQLEITLPEIKNGNAIDKAFWIEKERQQIIDAYWEGVFGWEGAELYYDTKYKTQTDG